jgi:hypothetical protein
MLLSVLLGAAPNAVTVTVVATVLARRAAMDTHIEL